MQILRQQNGPAVAATAQTKCLHCDVFSGESQSLLLSQVAVQVARGIAVPPSATAPPDDETG